MPVYRHICECGHEVEEFRSVSRFDEFPQHCGKPMRIRLMPVGVLDDIQPYKSMVTGEMVTSRSKHRDHLKRHDLIEVGNEVGYMTKPRQRVRLDNESRKRRIAEILNSRS